MKYWIRVVSSITLLGLLVACAQEAGSPIEESQLSDARMGEASVPTALPNAETHVPTWAAGLEFVIPSDFNANGKLCIDPHFMSEWSDEQKQQAQQALLAGREPETLQGDDLYHYLLLEYCRLRQSFGYKRPGEWAPVAEVYTGETIEVDLNGDGRLDRLTVEKSTPQHTTRVVVNDISLILEYDIEEFAIIDLDPDDDYLEIYIYSWLDGFLFYYDGENLVCMYENDISETDKIEPMLGGYMSGLSLTNDGKLYQSILCQVIMSYGLVQEYVLTPAHKLDRVEQDFYPMDYVVILHEPPLVLFREQDIISEKLRLDDYCFVRIIGVDREEWMLVETEEGETGWMLVKDYNQVFDGEEWSLHGLFYTPGL